jgi:hypothetical protein
MFMNFRKLVYCINFFHKIAVLIGLKIKKINNGKVLTYSIEFMKFNLIRCLLLNYLVIPMMRLITNPKISTYQSAIIKV